MVFHHALATLPACGPKSTPDFQRRQRPAWLLPVLLLLAALWLPGPGRAQPRPPRRLSVGGQLAGGGSHSLLVRPDGQLRSWGRNNLGQLGDGSYAQRPTPVAVAPGALPAGTRPTQVAAGYQHSLALAADGTVYAWGDNFYGQLGDGGASYEDVPAAVPLPAGGRSVQVAAGSFHSLALAADGTLYAWGNNYNGQVGDGTLTPRPTPVAVDLSALPAGTRLVQVAAGFVHSIALAADGTVYTWGNNDYGQLGDGTGNTRPAPAAVSGLPAGTRVVQVAAGEHHSLALTADGRLYCWGLNYTGQLGDGTTTDRARPVATALPAGTRLVQVAAGGYHSLALAADGTLYGWGYNSVGQVGNGTPSAYVSRPAAGVPGAMPAGTRLVQVAAGEYHSLALAADGTVYTWGYNDHGQLGDGSTDDRPTPVAPGPLPLPTGYAQAAGGLQHSLGLRADGIVYAWGDNGSGQLGDGSTDPRLTPVAVALPAGIRCVQVAAGYLHSLALAADGTVYAWGDNFYGQLGDGSTDARLTPVAVALPPGARCVQVVASEAHSLALLADGTVYAWGDNSYGQLGDGSTTQRPTPVAVAPGALPAGTRLVQVAAGEYHSLALAADGTVYAWGHNAGGQLGDGTTTNSPAPVAVAQGALPPGTRLVQVSAGQTHSLALAADGTAYAWGYSPFGQLGIGTLNTRHPTPVAVDLSALPAGTRLVQVAAGLAHSLALAADGRLYSWGLNDAGQLGDNSTAKRPAPTAEASGLTQWRQVAAGPMAYHSLVLGAGAAVFTAGLNDGGQLGDGSTRNSLVFVRDRTPLPVQLVAFTAQASGPAAAQLAWRTASEAGSARFEVERSPDGTRFVRLGQVAAAGTKATASNYAWLDAGAPAGTSYYRLRQVDLDGTAAYSPVRTVTLGADGLALYPNPAPGATTLSGAVPGQAVQVLDALGRVVATATTEAAGMVVLRGLAPGLYLVRAGKSTARLAVE